jgi:two-component system, cell cycle sensor histidine kinase PleC
MTRLAASKDRASGQWPVAVTLILCALFAAVIAIRAKTDYDSHRAEALAGVSTEARIAAAQLDGLAAGARTALRIVALQGALDGVTSASTLEGLEAVAGFDGAGALVQPGTAMATDVAPLSAAAQLATPEGWIGPLARGAGRFSPAIAVRTPDGGAIAGFLDLRGIGAPSGGRQILISDLRGTVLGAVPALREPQASALSAPLGDAYGLSLPEPADGVVARQASGPGGAPVIVASMATGSGLMVHLVRDRTALDLAWYRAALFYALLFLGPALAACGIWMLVKGQSERFEAVRQQMREAERRLRVAIDGARCGVWDWDLAADRVYMTDRLAKLFGFAGSGRFDTDDVLERLTQDDQIRLRAALAASARIGTLDTLITVNGPEGPVHMHLRGRAATERRVPGSIRVIGVSMDVSEQRDIELKVAEAESRLRDAIESISGPFALWSPQRRLVLWNTGFATTFGLEATILRRDASYDEVSRLAAQAVRSQASDSTDSQAQEIELKTGAWIRLQERPTSDGGLVTVGIDITTLKETEENILRSERQMRSIVAELERSERETQELAHKYAAEKMRAEEASTAKSSFLANMSHELRTPLNAINGFSQMMVQQIYGPLGDARYTDYARDILASGTHLLDLINDVLDMAKIEAGKFTIAPKSMILDEVIEQAVRMVKGRADERGVTLETDFADIDEITADPRAIKQIVLNLLSNAIKFTEAGGRVLVQTRAGMSDVSIRVVDTGIGIPPEHLPRLGHAFEQVESEHARQHQGSGLGLALCKSFAQMHGGNLTISSEVGVGTMVTVSLPRFASVRVLEAA